MKKEQRNANSDKINSDTFKKQKLLIRKELKRGNHNRQNFRDEEERNGEQEKKTVASPYCIRQIKNSGTPYRRLSLTTMKRE